MIQLKAPASGRIAVNQAKIAVLVAVLLMVSSIVAVSAIASQYAYTDLDIRIAGWVQALQIPGLDTLSRFVSFRYRRAHGGSTVDGRRGLLGAARPPTGGDRGLPDLRPVGR
jgi:O-succinylbenzoate synthase